MINLSSANSNNRNGTFRRPNDGSIEIASKKCRILYKLCLKRSLLEKKLIILSVLLFTVCFVLIIYIVSGTLLSKKVCKDPECLRSATRLLESMNTSVDPCVDFYEYSCGNWASRYITAPGESNTWFQEQSRHLTDHILRILHTPISNGGDITPVIQAKQLFRMCLDTEALDELGLEPVYEVLDKLQLPRKIPNAKNMANFNLAKTLASAQRVMSADILVALSTSVDDETNRTVFYISPATGESPLPDLWNSVKKRKYAASSNDQIFLERLSYVASVMSEFAPETMNSTAISVMAFRVIMLELRLKMDSEVYPVNNDIKVKFADLQDLMNYSKSTNGSSHLQFNWNEYLSCLMNGFNNSVDMNDTVIVNNPTYFYKLGKYLALNKAELFQRLIWWKVIEALAPHTTSLMRSFKDVFNQAVFQINSPSRASSCATVVKSFLSLALSYEISKETDYMTIFQEIAEIMKTIKDTFKHFISRSSWIDENIKKLAFLKVDNIRTFIGYPKEATDPNWISKYYDQIELSEKGYLASILNIKAKNVHRILSFINMIVTESESRTSWPLDPLDVNAYYSRESNSIAIPVGILQHPFYTEKVTLLNYAGIGFIMGHELTHGFDNEGKDYDWNGNRRSWWNKNVTDKFNKKAECFVNQYAEYRVLLCRDNNFLALGDNLNDHRNHVKGDNRPPALLIQNYLDINNTTTLRYSQCYCAIMINGSMTLAENIADNGGINQAYQAYSEYSSKHGDRLQLPGLEDFSPSQVFFLAFANVWCKKNSIFANALFMDDHSPAKYRVNGPLANLVEFSKAWSCPSNSPMNPDRKCELW